MAEVTAATRNCSSQYAESVLEALEVKYLEMDTDDYTKTEGIQILHNLTMITGSGNLMLPQCIALNYSRISKSGDAERLRELCRHVRELDIAENNLTDWNEVLNVINQIPRLQFINLSSNPLNSKISSIPNLTMCTKSLKGLALNNTKVPWHTVYELLNIMPGLEELHLSLNDYRRIPSPENKTYSQVHLLQFNENHITSWEELSPLGKAFPQLTSLILIGNKLSGTVTPEVGAIFSKLCYLNLTNTSMQSWQELESLKNFPSLVDTRVQGVPICEDISEAKRRQLCIARLGKVSRLNGSPVGDLEREDAERAFLRYYMDSANKPARYSDLEQKYGHLDRLAEIDLRPKNTVKCTINFEEKSEVMYVSVKQTIKEFIKSLSKWTGLPSTKLRVFYGDMEVNLQFGWEELKYHTRMMHSLNVRDGDEFMVDRK